jgi:beta-ketoacyl synthase-like protein
VRFVRFGASAALAGFGIVTVRDSGSLALGISGAILREDLLHPRPSGPEDAEARRRDRYGMLALIAAREAIEQAGLPLDGVSGARCGVALGTTHASAERNGRYALDLADPAAALSPSLFVRTTSGAAAADVAFAFKMGGPGLTFTSGWTAGAEAIAAAARSVSAGAADVVLAGGVEAAGPIFARSGPWISEGAALAVVTSRVPGRRRLLAYGRGRADNPTDLRAVVDAARAFECDTVVLANDLEADPRSPGSAGGADEVFPARARRLRVGEQTGALGAAGVVVGCAMGAEIPGRSLVVARDPSGEVAALVIG